MKRLFLDPPFASAWVGRDAFAAAADLDGEVFRKVKTRRTVRFELGGGRWFLKYHRGVGWREILKNLFSFKLPVVSARNEFSAIRACEKIGVPTMRCAAFGERGANPAAIESFIITAEIPDAVSLEELAARGPVPFARRRELIRETARISRALHTHGINHRDYYLCHFLLAADGLHLIDLHRAQLRRRVPRRYLVKDMAGLWFSAMDAHLNRTDLLRFVAGYSGRKPGEELRLNAGFWRAVNRAAVRLYRRINRRNPSTDPFRNHGK